MRFQIFAILVILTLSSVMGDTYNVENPDGSTYSIDHQSNYQRQNENSVLSFLTKANNPEKSENPSEDDAETSASEYNPVIDALSGRASGLITPHLEILNLIEIFLKFKGELASRLHEIVNDNYDLIRSVYYTLISKVGSLHRFTLTGITILRKVLEFAVALLGQWQIVPSPPAAIYNTNSYGTPKPEGLDFNANTFYKNQ